MQSVVGGSNKLLPLLLLRLLLVALLTCGIT